MNEQPDESRKQLRRVALLHLSVVALLMVLPEYCAGASGLQQGVTTALGVAIIVLLFPLGLVGLFFFPAPEEAASVANLLPFLGGTLLIALNSYLWGWLCQRLGRWLGRRKALSGLHRMV